MSTSDFAENPFSTRHVRPGAIPYQFPPGQSAESLVAELAQSGWRGQIIGPHGCGKSSLLQALRPALESAGRTPLWVELHAHNRRWPDVSRRLAVEPSGVLVIDGFEQCSRWRRWLIRRSCRRHGWGLLITAHRDLGLPTLAEPRPSVEVVIAVVEKLLANRDRRHITPDDIRHCFTTTGANFRETLFALYDLYETRKP